MSASVEEQNEILWLAASQSTCVTTQEEPILSPFRILPPQHGSHGVVSIFDESLEMRWLVEPTWHAFDVGQ